MEIAFEKAVPVTCPVLVGNSNVHRGAIARLQVRDLGSIADWDVLLFTARSGEGQAAPLIQIRKAAEGDAMVVLGGEAIDPTDAAADLAEILILDEAAGHVDVLIHTEASAALAPGDHPFDLQILRGAAPSAPAETLVSGTLHVDTDNRAVA